NMQLTVIHVGLLGGLVLLWHLIFVISGLYRSKRLSNLKRETLDIVKATTLGTLTLYLLAGLLYVDNIPPMMLGIFWSGAIISTVLLRIGMRTALKWIRLQGRNLRHVLIVGTNSRAVQFAKEVEAKPELGYIISGFVDYKGQHCDLAACEAFKQAGYPVVSDFNGLPAFLRQHVVDEVFVALPVNSFYQEALRIINICAEQGIIIRHLPEIFNTGRTNFKLKEIEELSTVSPYNGSMEGWQILAKWALDKILSATTLLLLAPLFLITAIVIKIDSRGSIFFIQERVGFNKRVFRVFKFRTMTENAHQSQSDLEHLNEASGPVFKISNDPRITRVGKFLRKTSIDEFPQLVNVLKGDMSIVGPRPLPLRDFYGFSSDWLYRRFRVLPGITCLWQINGRSSVPFEKWMEMDLQYIDQWSLWLDLKILAGTFRAVLNGSGAV
ncbi:MAG: sugar transferase, partial [Desulfobacterales bacterium]